MPDTTASICIRVTLLNSQGQPLGGTVKLDFKPQSGGAPVSLKGDASKDIDVSGLQRGPQGAYQLTVTAGSAFQPVSQTVSIPPEGFATVRIVVPAKATDVTNTQSSSNTLRGSLVFDHGQLAAGVAARLYNVGFGGKDQLLAETKTNAQGEYSFAYNPPGAAAPNLQVRALDPAGKEINISATKFGARTSETLNLVVPSIVQPLAPEFARLSGDMDKSIGGLANLAQAEEGANQQDLTLLNQSTNWDARLLTLAAQAAQQAAATGLGTDVLYALFRVGLPSDPKLLAAVPSSTVQAALTKANQAGIISLNADGIAKATTSFQNFSAATLLNSTTPGGVSTFHDLLTPHFKDNPQQQAAFANLYFSQTSPDAGFWDQAAKLQIPATTLNALRLQGKFLYLTLNNAVLAQKLQQDIGSLENLPSIADRDYHQPVTWQNTLTALAGTGGDQALQGLIPSAYSGATTAERLAAYAGDLARKVRIGFPTRVAARMIESKELKADPKAIGTVPAFLRAASSAGYNLGRTPLNTFIAKSGAGLPALDDASMQSLKTLHRMYQITPSTESLQAATNLNFKSAQDIASYSKTEFLEKYAYAFPKGEAEMVYGQARVVSSVTFNVYSIAKQLDTSPPVYALSSPAGDRQDAKNALIQQFPSMASLFGNLDFCECDECRSVLSPAAYFVDVLDLLGQHSAPNAAGNTPLDVLIGKDGGIAGRRPDLGALPLTCENTNTAMPYIDLVNEILEYYIAHSVLDAKAAYDTGSASTADLVAEPQHILPDVYTTTLKQANYPLNLPFDLWLETTRGFLGYLKAPLAQVLDTLRPADSLELFTSMPATSYYRAQILAEALQISPAEYAVFTATDTTQWFNLYATPGTYADQNAAMTDLRNAKTLSQRLGVSYQDLADLMKTGFLNPALYPLIFQFERLGIDMGTAFSFTSQPGYPPLSAPDGVSFQALLDNLKAQYLTRNPSSTFDAKAWLTKLLPANYSKKVLVLADPNTGCNFAGTTLQYADGSAAQPLDFLKLNLFVRLWKKLGWSMDETDRALQAFFPPTLPAFTDASFSKTFGDAWKTALVYLAHLDDLNTLLAPALGRVALLPLWTDLPVQGENPLYAQLFLTPGVLNNDFTFDDPNGQFPLPATDLAAGQALLSAHSATIQGVLSLTSAEVGAILQDASAPNGFSLANLSTCYRYSLLAQCLQLPVADMIALKTMAALNPFQALSGTPLHVLKDDILLNQTIAFVKQVAAVQNSGFTVTDLKYLLRHQFDPVGPYQSDPDALIALVRTLAALLRQIQAQYAVPANLPATSESLIDQTLSSLFPAAILKSLFAQFTNSQTYTSTASSATGLDPADFAQEPEITVSFDTVTSTQSVSYKGLLLDWKKAEIQNLNSNAALNALLASLLNGVQQQAEAALGQSIGDILGVWASLVQYEAVATGITSAQSITDPLGKLTQADASLRFSYDQSDQLQWLGYRGALTDAKVAVLTGINASATLAKLLTKIQEQSLPAYNELTGSLLAMWCNAQTYQFAKSGVAPGNQVDPDAFAAALSSAQQTGTITDPVPSVQFAYDSTSQIQTLTCQGVLTDSLRGKLAALVPVAILPGLLQSVRDQAAQLYHTLATGLLTVGPNDLDTYVAQFQGTDSTKQQKFAKAELVKVFLPLLARKLSSQLVLQTLSGSLGSDPSLTEALVTDAALLNDPSNPGESLLQAFLAVGQQGVSASYCASPDQSGSAHASGTAGTTDTTDPTNNQPGTASCHFEGYLQVPTDGPYRFFAQLGNAGAKATLTIDAPDPSALFTNPIFRNRREPWRRSQPVRGAKGGVRLPLRPRLPPALGRSGASC